MDRFVDLKDAQSRFAECLREARQGMGVFITENGQPIARLAPLESAPRHRTNAPRFGVTLSPEFEPADARLARLGRESQVPYRLRRRSR